MALVACEVQGRGVLLVPEVNLSASSKQELGDVHAITRSGVVQGASAILVLYIQHFVAVAGQRPVHLLPRALATQLVYVDVLVALSGLVRAVVIVVLVHFIYLLCRCVYYYWIVFIYHFITRPVRKLREYVVMNAPIIR